MSRQASTASLFCLVKRSSTSISGRPDMISTSFREHPCPETSFRHLPQLPQCPRPDSHTAVHRISSPHQILRKWRTTPPIVTKPAPGPISHPNMLSSERRKDLLFQLDVCRFARASPPPPKIPDGEKGVLRLGRLPRQCNPSKPRNPGVSRWRCLRDGDGYPSPSRGHMHEPSPQLLPQNAEGRWRESLFFVPRPTRGAPTT